MTLNIDISKLREVHHSKLIPNELYLIRHNESMAATWYAIPDNFNPNESDEFALYLDMEYDPESDVYRQDLINFREIRSEGLKIEPLTFTGNKQEVIQAMENKLRELKG